MVTQIRLAKKRTKLKNIDREKSVHTTGKSKN